MDFADIRLPCTVAVFTLEKPAVKGAMSLENINLSAKALQVPELTQDAFINSCITSKTDVDIYIQSNHIYSCKILAHDSLVIMIKMGDKVALVYKNAVQAIVPEHEKLEQTRANSGQILADVRTQYMRYLTKNRASGTIKGN